MGCQQYKIHKGLVATDSTQIKKLSIPQYSEKMLRAILVEMIITDEMPFTTVDQACFCKFVHTLESRFLMPSRYTVMRNCLKMHANEKATMKEMFLATG